MTLMASTRGEWHLLRGFEGALLALALAVVAVIRGDLLLAGFDALMSLAFAIYWASPLRTRRLKRAEDRRKRRMIEGPFDIERDRDE